MPAQCESIHAEIDREGFAIVHPCVPQHIVDSAITAISIVIESTPGIRSRDGAAFAIRNALSAAPALRAVAECPELLAAVVQAISGTPFVTRAILFDKNPNANWAVPWHQDITIAVQQRIDTPGFGPWSKKAGVTHVQPPAAVLERMITARVHLDDCNETNGALRVIPGSHQCGFVAGPEIGTFKSRSAAVCSASASDVLLMKPLLLHASSPATLATRRRILHLEFASEDLPNGLEWNRA